MNQKKKYYLRKIGYKSNIKKNILCLALVTNGVCWGAMMVDSPHSDSSVLPADYNPISSDSSSVVSADTVQSVPTTSSEITHNPIVVASQNLDHTTILQLELLN